MVISLLLRSPHFQVEHFYFEIHTVEMMEFRTDDRRDDVGSGWESVYCYGLLTFKLSIIFGIEAHTVEMIQFQTDEMM